MTNFRSTVLVTALACGVLMAGCGGRAYIYEPFEGATISERAESQSQGTVRVSAAVPGREETEAIFGIPLYDQSIQPVWLEVENTGSEQVRYAPVSTDRFYFSPLEVAYMNRGGYTDEGRVEMEKLFHGLAMPRYIDAGESRSGFVFTHADLGAKGFNVDLFGSGQLASFTFLLRVPGFTPDYANVNFDGIYAPAEVTEHGQEDLQAAIRALPCCGKNGSGDKAKGVANIVLISAGRELLRAMLRSNWIETSEEEAADRSAIHMFGRKQDAIFRRQSLADDSVFELRLWLAPITAGEKEVWVGQVRHYFTVGSPKWRSDPDVDTARNFALQNFFYGQALKQQAWVSSDRITPFSAYRSDPDSQTHFTDGYRVVLWLSGEPVSMLDIETLDWDTPPGWRQ